MDNRRTMCRGAAVCVLMAGLAQPNHAAADQYFACSTSGSYCRSISTQAVWSYVVPFHAGSVYTISTWNLDVLPGSSYAAADTVVWLLNLDTGMVEAIDDDGNANSGPGSGPYWDLDSWITFVPSTSFYGRVVIASRGAFTEGIMDVSVMRDGTELLPAIARTDIPFGGWTRVSDVRANDRLYLGGWDDNDIYFNTLYLFESTALDCSSNCGQFQAADGPLPAGPVRHVDGLSFIRAAWTDSSTLILGGGAAPFHDVDTRLFHARVHQVDGGRWSGNGYLDRDGDGLTWELEASLGTCDDSTGPSRDCTICESAFPPTCPATQCHCFGDRHPKVQGATPPYDMSDVDFDARDTDHDGLTDFEEVFGKSLLCDALHTPVLGMPPATCDNISVDGCPSPTACTPRSQVAFSALGADPREYDVYVEVDSLGTTATNLFLGPLLPDVEAVYRDEGRECPENTGTTPASCPGQLDWYYSIRPHVYEDEIVGDAVPESNWTWGETFARSHFIRDFTRTRRDMDVFRYAVGVDRGGQALPSVRRMVFGYPGRRDAVFVHELGHTMSLLHGGFEGRNLKLNYPSLMNYRYDYEGITKAAPGGYFEPWPVGAPCTTNADCGQTATCAAGQCAVDCGSLASAVSERHVRFSRGNHGPLYEPSLLEQEVFLPGVLPNRTYAAQIFCADAGPTFCSCNPGFGWCPNPAVPPGVPSATWGFVSGAWVDYDNDAVNDGAAPVIAPIDGENPGDCTIQLNTARDNDDWMQMYREGSHAESGEPNGGAIIYFSRMQDTADDTFTGFTAPLANPPLVGAATFVPGYATWGNALFVNNSMAPFNTSYLSLLSAPQWESMGTTVEGRAPSGLSVRLQFNLASFAFGSGHVLIANDLFRVEVSNATQRLQVWFHDGVSWGQPIVHPTVLSPNMWYALAFRWWRTQNGPAFNGVIDIAPQDANPANAGQFLLDNVNRVCIRHYLEPQAERPVGETRIGAGFSAGWGLVGAIDHLAIKNYPEKEWQPDDDACP